MRKLFLFLLLACIVFAQTQLEPSVTDNGGGSKTSTSLKLHASIGQAVSGPSGESLIAGFVTVELYSDSNAVEESFLPDGISIGEFSPNPFNSSTAIRVDMEEEGQLTLIVSDLLGKQVFYSESQRKAGVYILTFSASEELSTGMYLYKIVAGVSHKKGKFSLVN